MTKWQDISTAPTDGTPVLLYGKLEGEIHSYESPGDIIVGSFQYGRWTMDNTDGYEVNCYADYWQPLPPPPSLPESK